MATGLTLSYRDPTGGARYVQARPGGFRIGRGDDCDLGLHDPTVSRQHALIWLERDQWCVRDLGSANGTLHNGTRADSAVLRHGDRLRVGDTEFAVSIGAATKTAVAPAAVAGSLAFVGIVLIVALAGWSPGQPTPQPTPPAAVAAAAPTSASTSAPATPAPATPTARPPATATIPPTSAPTVPSLEDAVDKVKRSTTVIVVTLANGSTGSGSGVSVDAGRVVTANHVTESARQIKIRVGSGRTGVATVVRADRKRDLALLDTGFTSEPAAAFSDGKTLRAGETLVAIGYPRVDVIGADDPTVTKGIFSSRWQSGAGVWHIQTDTPINPGNSGGPLIDSRGAVVGIAVFGIKGTVGLNYAVAGDEVLDFLAGR